MNLQLGVLGQAQTTVTSLTTAKAMGSGLFEVFATPAMVALMEQAAVNSLNLLEGQSSVGTGAHERYIIDVEPFLVKAQSRKLGL